MVRHASQERLGLRDYGYIVIRNSFIIRSTLTPWYNDWYNERISDNHYYCMYVLLKWVYISYLSTCKGKKKKFFFESVMCLAGSTITSATRHIDQWAEDLGLEEGGGGKFADLCVQLGRIYIFTKTRQRGTVYTWVCLLTRWIPRWGGVSERWCEGGYGVIFDLTSR